MRKIRINTERVYLMSPNANICMKADIDGEISAEQLYSAIEKLGIIHPIIKSSVEIDDSGKAYFIPGLVETITPRWFEASTEDDWKNAIDKYDNIMFDMSNGALIRFIMIHQKGMATLIVIGHRILGDELSYVYLIRDFLDILANTDAEIQEKTPIFIRKIEDFPKNCKKYFFIHDMVKNANKEWLGKKTVFLIEDEKKLYEEYRKKHDISMKMIHVDSYSMLKINNIIKDKKVSIIDMVVTAYIYALRKFIQKDPLKKEIISYSIDVRGDLLKEHEPSLESMGNYSSEVTTRQEYDFEFDFFSNVVKTGRTFKKKIGRIKNRLLSLYMKNNLDKSLTDAAVLQTFGDYEDKSAYLAAQILGLESKEHGLHVSSIIEPNISLEYGKYKLKDIAYVCPMSQAEGISLGVSLVNGRMNICVRYDKTEIEEEIINNISDEAMKKIYGE